MNYSRFISCLGMGLILLVWGCTTLSSDLPSAQPSSPAASSASPPPSASPVEPAAPSPIAENQDPMSESESDPGSQSESGQFLPISAEAELGGQVIQLEVARTPAEQSMGLMHRPPLPDDRGMLFPFEPARPVRFWMKNTPSPLDMIFLRDGEIQAIAPNVPPCTSDPCPTYGPSRPTAIDQVIELRSGRAAELGLTVGDTVEIRFLE